MKKIYLHLLFALTAFALPISATNEIITTAEELATKITSGTSDTIYLSGNFTVSSEITINRDIVLKGLDNPILTGGGENRFFTISSGTIVIDGITFTEGIANSNGGAIYINGGTPNVTIQNSRYIKNKVSGGYGGGAICINPSSATTVNFYNCVFAHNENSSSSYGYGGAISSTQKANTINLVNCTFANNRGGRYGGHHLSVESGGKMYVTNCIFWGGTNTGITSKNENLQIRCNAAYLYMYHNIADGAFWEEGFYNNDIQIDNGTYHTPAQWSCDVSAGTTLFTAPSSTPGYDASDALTADYTLVHDGIGKGDQSVVNIIPTTDVAGNERVNGFLDIGAYENQTKRTVSVDNEHVTITPSGTDNAWYAEDFHFSLTPDEGYIISLVKQEETTLTPSDEIYTLSNVTENLDLTVLAELPQHEVTVTTNGVTINSPSLTDHKFTAGTTATITFTLQAGYENPSVMVNETPYMLDDAIDGVYTISLTDITDATSIAIAATQIKLDFTINFGTGIHEILSTTNITDGKVGYGDSVSVTFNLSADFHCPYVSVNGIKTNITEEEDSYTLSLPSVTKADTIILSAYATNILPTIADTYISSQNETGKTESAKALSPLMVQGSDDNTYLRRSFIEFNTNGLVLSEYNKVKLKLTYYSAQYTTRPTSLYINTVTTENVQTLDDLTWANSENQTNIPSGVSISEEHPIDVEYITNGFQESFELYYEDIKSLIGTSSDGIIRLQLNTTYGEKGGNNIKFHSLENGVADYVPQLIFSASPTAINNSSTSELSVYVNATNHIVINSPDSETNLHNKVLIFNIQGEKVMEQPLNKKETIVRGNFNKGLYLVKIGDKVFKVSIK